MNGGRKRAGTAKADASAAAVSKVTLEGFADDIAAAVTEVVQVEMAMMAQVMGMGVAVMTPHPPQSEAEVEEGFDNMPV